MVDADPPPEVAGALLPLGRPAEPGPAAPAPAAEAVAEPAAAEPAPVAANAETQA